MWKFWQIALLDAAVIGISYLIFRYALNGEVRHRIWEKYIDSFSVFVIILFLVTVLLDVATFYILYRLDMRQYVNTIATALSSIIIGFVIALVPQRGMEHDGTKKGAK